LNQFDTASVSLKNQQAEKRSEPNIIAQMKLHVWSGKCCIDSQKTVLTSSMQSRLACLVLQIPIRMASFQECKHDSETHDCIRPSAKLHQHRISIRIWRVDHMMLPKVLKCVQM